MENGEQKMDKYGKKLNSVEKDRRQKKIIKKYEERAVN